MKKFLIDEFQEITLNSEDAFRKFLHFRKENDKWQKVCLKEVNILGIANEPLFQMGDEMEVDVTKNDITYKVNLPLTEDALFAIKEGLGMFLAVPVAKIPATPLSYTGYSTLLQRAGINGPVMNTFKGTSRKKALSLQKKQNILNDCFGLFTPDSKTWGWVLFRDGRIPAFNSSAYGILNCWEICEALEEKMKEEHPDFAFHKARITEEFLTVQYLLHDDLANDSFANLLRSFNMDVEEVQLGIGMATSDVGLSEVVAYPFLILNNRTEIRIGRGIGMRHDSCNDIPAFKKVIVPLASVFDECEDRIEKLGNTDINNVGVVVNAICQNNPTIFPKEFVDSYRKNLRVSAKPDGTAMDCYLALYDIAEAYMTAKKPSINRRLVILDHVSRLMFADFKKYDI